MNTGVPGCPKENRGRELRRVPERGGIRQKNQQGRERWREKVETQEPGATYITLVLFIHLQKFLNIICSN